MGEAGEVGGRYGSMSRVSGKVHGGDEQGIQRFEEGLDKGLHGLRAWGIQGLGLHLLRAQSTSVDISLRRDEEKKRGREGEREGTWDDDVSQTQHGKLFLLRLVPAAREHKLDRRLLHAKGFEFRISGFPSVVWDL